MDDQSTDDVVKEKVIKSERIYFNTGELYREREYDTEGNMVKFIVYDSDGNMISYKEWEYDTKGKQVSGMYTGTNYVAIVNRNTNMMLMEL